MSADTISICPVCAAEKLGKPWREIDQLDLEKAWGLMLNQLREFHEAYIDKGMAVFHYGLRCHGCDYKADVTLTERLPEPQ